MDGATITGVLDRLEKLELIERRSDPNDRRTNLIFLTPQGKELEKPLNQLTEEVNNTVISLFSEEEAKLLKNMLTKLGLS